MSREPKPRLDNSPGLVWKPRSENAIDCVNHGRHNSKNYAVRRVT
jgi:hypothetical protein